MTARPNPCHTGDPAREVLLRRMERVLERPLSPEEIRLVLLAETIRDELEGRNRERAA